MPLVCNEKPLLDALPAGEFDARMRHCLSHADDLRRKDARRARLGGDREGLACQTAADCPHVFPKPGETCQARPSSMQPGEAYTVPVGAALVVTDVHFDGTFTLASDDQKTKVTVAGTQHFTAGIVLPAGSRVNMTRSPAVAGQLLGYLVRAQEPRRP